MSIAESSKFDSSSLISLIASFLKANYYVFCWWELCLVPLYKKLDARAADSARLDEN
jgi:hypothetical protein